jgi:hypothetical protein
MTRRFNDFVSKKQARNYAMRGGGLTSSRSTFNSDSFLSGKEVFFRLGICNCRTTFIEAA